MSFAHLHICFFAHFCLGSDWLTVSVLCLCEAAGRRCSLCSTGRRKASKTECLPGHYWLSGPVHLISSVCSRLPRLTGTLSCRSPSKPLARKLLGGTDWESVSRNSLSDERLETQSLPTRSPPGTPNQWVSRFTSGQKMQQHFECGRRRNLL